MMEDIGQHCDDAHGGCSGVKMYWTADVVTCEENCRCAGSPGTECVRAMDCPPDEDGNDPEEGDCETPATECVYDADGDGHPDEDANAACVWSERCRQGAGGQDRCTQGACCRGEGTLKLQAQLNGIGWVAVGVSPHTGGGMVGAQVFMLRRKDGSTDVTAVDIHQYEVKDRDGTLERFEPGPDLGGIAAQHPNYTQPVDDLAQVSGGLSIMLFETKVIGEHKLKLGDEDFGNYENVVVAFGHDTEYGQHRGYERFKLNWVTCDIVGVWEATTDTPGGGHWLPTKEPTPNINTPPSRYPTTFAPTEYPTKLVVSWAPTVAATDTPTYSPTIEDRVNLGLLLLVLILIAAAVGAVIKYFLMTQKWAKKSGRPQWKEAIEPVELALKRACAAVKVWLCQKVATCKRRCTRRKRNKSKVDASDGDKNKRKSKKGSKRHKKGSKRHSKKGGSKRRKSSKRKSKRKSKRRQRIKLKDLAEATLHKGSRVRIIGMGDPEGLKGIAKDFDQAGEKWDVLVARRSSAEHLIATKALRCTATAWMLTVAESLAKF